MDIQNQQSQHNNEALYEEIAERERTEAALHTSEARFQMVLQGSSTTVFTHDRELRYTWMYSASPEEQWILGKTDLELAQADNYPHLTPQEAHLLTDLKQHALDSGQGSRQKISLTYDGHSKWYDLKIEPLRDEDGSIAGLTCVATDITEYQRTLEQQHLLSDRDITLTSDTPCGNHTWRETNSERSSHADAPQTDPPVRASVGRCGCG
jgi:PAS domain S-box-containing protein